MNTAPFLSGVHDHEVLTHPAIRHLLDNSRDGGCMAEVSKSGKPLGPIGTEVLFENEHIRVWSVELPPKGHQPLHQHQHPYLIVPVSEGRALMRWEDGREREINDVLGRVVFREASGGPHELFNLEEKTKMHSILVEIKAVGISG
jgi:beta-alanine degradation protein BauB